MPVKVRRCVIDGRSAASLNDVYDALASQLPFPAHFGRNLDALWDVLTGDVPGPLEIRLESAAACRKTLKADFDRIVQLLREASEERDDFTFIVTE